MVGQRQNDHEINNIPLRRKMLTQNLDVNNQIIVGYFMGFFVCCV